MRLSGTLKAAALLAALALATTGCDDSKDFKDAPRASASAAVSGSGGADGSSGLGPVSGMELPPGHPPIGNEGAAAQDLPAPQVPRAAPGQYGTVGPLRWKAPENWQARPPANEMRFAEYNVPGAQGVEPAELTVFFFGPGQGGGVEDNLQRWASQLNGGSEAVFGEETINGVRVHTVDASGAYDAGMAMGGGPARADQRLLGAIAETAEGLFFFRLLGPKSVVDGEADAFRAFLDSFHHG